MVEATGARRDGSFIAELTSLLCVGKKSPPSPLKVAKER
jgi:hypothetical protein